MQEKYTYYYYWRNLFELRANNIQPLYNVSLECLRPFSVTSFVPRYLTTNTRVYPCEKMFDRERDIYSFDVNRLA